MNSLLLLDALLYAKHPKRKIPMSAVDQNGANGKIFVTPSRHGNVYFVAVCNSTVNIRATDGTGFSFDLETLSYVKDITSCTTP